MGEMTDTTSASARRRHRPEPVLPGLLRGSRREPRHAWSSSCSSSTSTRADDEELNAIFRCAHSVKGGAATFGFADVAELTHQMETLLDKLRRHELRADRADGRRAAAAGRRAARPSWRATRAPAATRSTPRELLADIRALVARPGAAPRAGRAPRPRPPPRRPLPRCRASVARALELTRRPARRPDARRQPGRAVQGDRRPRHDRAARRRPVRPTACAASRSSTTSSDNDLLDLFTFHVAREQVQLAAAGRRATASTRARPARREPRRRRTPATASSTTRPARRRARPPSGGRTAPARTRRRRPQPRRRAPKTERPAAAVEVVDPARLGREGRPADQPGRRARHHAGDAGAEQQAASTPRCTSSSPPAWPTWSATRATCRKR